MTGLGGMAGDGTLREQASLSTKQKWEGCRPYQGLDLQYCYRFVEHNGGNPPASTISLTMPISLLQSIVNMFTPRGAESADLNSRLLQKRTPNHELL